MKQATVIKRKTGLNRGTKSRLWIEGKTLTNHGWTTGTDFEAFTIDASTSPDASLRAAPFISDPCGFLVYAKGCQSAQTEFWNCGAEYHTLTRTLRKVAGNPGRPILDTCGDLLSRDCGFMPGDVLTVIVSDRFIIAYNPEKVDLSAFLSGPSRGCFAHLATLAA